MTDFTDPVSMRALNATVVEEFRANGGRVTGMFVDSALLLLTTTGARTGQPRLTPLAYHRVDGKLFVVGSNGGSSRDPGWVRNLRVNPLAQVDFGDGPTPTGARELGSAERDAVFTRVIEQAPQFAKYAGNAHRTVPLFELIVG
ncbi:nitroreductase/quinone reductase family protein [Mycolicibacterium poriferae]|uniref:nitroreductase/quinone reductase family protein n=1 Tax=Mycolicibacterium poriferae TaxID=39694 RepID=UPI0024BBD690|nr:nitroreductase/quinone reductase family protein [Mycolicibacterium poriferae]